MAPLRITEIAPYLHDADVEFLTYSNSAEEIRTLRFQVTCVPDAGLEEIDGKTLELTAYDVVVFNYNAWGYVVGKLTIDHWDFSISKAIQTALSNLESDGITIPGSKHGISFHDGSGCEFVCRELSIEVCE